MESSSGEETALRFARDAHARDVGTLQQFPVVAVRGPVVKLAGVLDGPPVLVLGGDQDLGCGLLPR